MTLAIVLAFFFLSFREASYANSEGKEEEELAGLRRWNFLDDNENIADARASSGCVSLESPADFAEERCLALVLILLFENISRMRWYVLGSKKFADVN